MIEHNPKLRTKRNFKEVTMKKLTSILLCMLLVLSMTSALGESVVDYS